MQIHFFKIYNLYFYVDNFSLLSLFKEIYCFKVFKNIYRFNSVYDISDKDGRWLAEVMQTPSPKRKYGPLM